MDETKQQLELQPVGMDHKYEFLKRILQLLFSVFLFSFILSYRYGIFCFISYLNMYISTVVVPLFNQVTERKYMFLVCNGILVVVARNFDFSTSPPPVRPADLLLRHGYASELPHKNGFMVEQEEEEGNLFVEGEERETGKLFMEEEEEEDEGERERGSKNAASNAPAGPAMAAEEAEGNERLQNTEELNKKFEEFIRRMKEEIRLEAQRQLIAV